MNLAVPGDTAGNMFQKGGKQLKIIDRILGILHIPVYTFLLCWFPSSSLGTSEKKVLTTFAALWRMPKFDMIFISAAGNDIVGEEIREFIDDYGAQNRHGAGLINKKFDRILRDVVLRKLLQPLKSKR